MELFDRTAAAGGQLLRAHRVPTAAGASTAEALGFLLTFDVGRILVTAAGGHLVARTIEELADVPADVVDVSEDEPWWRLLGAKLARGLPEAGGQRLGLEFEIANARPRVLAIAHSGGRVRAALETGH